MGRDNEPRIECMVMVFLGICLICAGYTAGYFECKWKYSDFETQYNVLSGCRLKLDGKWVPDERYYFKEE